MPLVASTKAALQSEGVARIGPEDPDSASSAAVTWRITVVARPGDVLENPITGERVTFLKTASQTNGLYVRLELEVAGTGVSAPLHIHPRLEERLTIVRGEWALTIDGVAQRIEPGVCVTIPTGRVHTCSNAGAETGVAIVEFAPALKAEESIESAFGLAQDGLVDPVTSVPVQPWLALLLIEIGEEFSIPAEPAFPELQEIMRPIADEARRQGLRVPYPYSYPTRAEDRLIVPIGD
jgi:mannose-6-phosphate isomerase-like protein (cupin superfamily)